MLTGFLRSALSTGQLVLEEEIYPRIPFSTHTDQSIQRTFPSCASRYTFFHTLGDKSPATLMPLPGPLIYFPYASRSCPSNRFRTCRKQLRTRHTYILCHQRLCHFRQWELFCELGIWPRLRYLYQVALCLLLFGRPSGGRYMNIVCVHMLDDHWPFETSLNSCMMSLHCASLQYHPLILYRVLLQGQSRQRATYYPHGETCALIAPRGMTTERRSPHTLRR